MAMRATANVSVYDEIKANDDINLVNDTIIFIYIYFSLTYISFSKYQQCYDCLLH